MALIGARHAFVPLEAAPYRCAKCLRQIDCAPHLPIAPTATYPEPGLARRIYNSTESRRRALVPRLAADRAPAVSRAAR